MEGVGGMGREVKKKRKLRFAKGFTEGLARSWPAIRGKINNVFLFFPLRSPFCVWEKKKIFMIYESMRLFAIFFQCNVEQSSD